MSQKDNETKQRILTESLKLIKEQGYDQVTLQDICKAAEISKHTFYYYFKSKDAILLEFYTIPNQITESKLSTLLSAENYLEQFWLLFLPAIEFFEDAGPEIVKRIYIANLTRDIGTFNHSKHHSNLLKAQVSIIKKAQDAGEILNTSDPLSLLLSCFFQMMGISTRWCITNEGFDLKTAIRAAIETCLNVTEELRITKGLHPEVEVCKQDN